MRYRTWKTIFLGGFIFLLVFLFSGIKNNAHHIDLLREDQENSFKVAEAFSRNIRQQIEQDLDARKPPQDVKHKNFIYLIQTEQCLPPILLQNDHLGNSSLCQCDVLVLSFKRPCKENNSPHAEYLYGKNTSWSEGRNILYQRAQARNLQYLYYIFLDDDIQFGYAERYTPAEMKTRPPLRAFEEFLITHEPAVGVSNYQVHHNADTMNKKIGQICKTNALQNSLYVPTVHFDASFNAFHRNTINYILPYTNEYDKICWWHSQRYVIAAVEIIFRGHAVMFTPVEAWNVAHGPYPRNDQDAERIWSSMVKTLRSHVPKEFQSEAWIQDFINHPVKFTENSPSICFNLPPHHPIEPYSHFKIRSMT